MRQTNLFTVSQCPLKIAHSKYTIIYKYLVLVVVCRASLSGFKAIYNILLQVKHLRNRTVILDNIKDIYII